MAFNMPTFSSLNKINLPTDSVDADSVNRANPVGSKMVSTSMFICVLCLTFVYHLSSSLSGPIGTENRNDGEPDDIEPKTIEVISLSDHTPTLFFYLCVPLVLFGIKSTTASFGIINFLFVLQ